MPIDNEEGIAYGFMMIILFFVAGTVIWLAWAYIFDIILGTIINPDILVGGISKQTAHAVGWNVDVLRYAPPVMILGGFMWTVNRALYRRTS